MPYRSRREEAPKPAPTAGLVTDMVRQFADPYAFLRELVQNGIDAGASAIDVRIEELPEGVVATSVADNGSGMTRAIIEGPLLTLFSSSKEGDTKKIGKYGVGFVSIFALDPDEVQVSTGRDGESWLLRLFRDHSYELEVGGPRTSNGTKVTLLTKRPEAKASAEPAAARRKKSSATPEAAGSPGYWNMDPSELLERASDMLDAALSDVNASLKPPPAPEPDTRVPDFEEHAWRVRAALNAWCRHAQCPITLTVIDPLSPDVKTETRIDTPLTVNTPTSVIDTRGGEVIVVGASAGSDLLTWVSEPPPEAERSKNFAGFYNRGLTLFETDQALFEELRGIRFKVMSHKLQHTLSRDNVRRDEAFDRILERVKEIVAGPLKRQVVSDLAEAAERASRGDARLEYAALLEAAQTPVLAIKPRQITFPLVDPMPGSGERTVRDFSSHISRGQPLLFARASDPLTVALARTGVIVVLCPDDYVQKALRWCSKYPLEEAHNVYALIRELGPGELTEADTMLAEEVRGAVADADQPVARVAFARFGGAAASMVAIVTPDAEPEGDRVYELTEIRGWWRRWTRRRALILNIDVETIDYARRRAAKDPALAGHLLARSLLLRGGDSIPAGANERLLERAGKGLQ